MSTHAAVKTLLTRLRERWRARNEFASMDQNECDHLAREFGMTAKDLETLVRRGPNAANLLYERMRALGMSVEHVGHGLMRDLEKTCALCDDKGVCKKDLARKSHDFRWKSYCPNAITLDEALTRLRGHSERLRPMTLKENRREYLIRTACEAREQAKVSDDFWGKKTLEYVGNCCDLLAQELDGSGATKATQCHPARAPTPVRIH